MRILKPILCLGLLLMVWVGFTHAVEEKKPVPVIELQESIYEFPQVTEGEVVTHKFRVFNRGNAPLQIKSVKPG